jgi:HAMP domain-containing protein
MRAHLANGEVAKMTDEERQKLCQGIRDWRYLLALPDWAASQCDKAADEIERLAADVRALRQQIEHYHGKWGKRDD